MPPKKILRTLKNGTDKVCLRTRQQTSKNALQNDPRNEIISVLSNSPVKKQKIDAFTEKVYGKVSQETSGNDCSENSDKSVNDGSLVTKTESGVVPANPLGMKYVGAHVSISGGLFKAPLEAKSMGARAFGLFLRSQRQWNAKPLVEVDAKKFRETLKELGFEPRHVVPHGSYLLNCGSPNAETLKKSRDSLVDELKRCEMLGLIYYNFHPGSTCNEISREKCIELIAESINMAHEQTQYCVTLIENMCKQGNTIGGDFAELRSIIDLVKAKNRIGVCFDTCHAFAAGYDLSDPVGYENCFRDFDRIVGLYFLKALHLNDSKGDCGSHLDRHEDIGKGKLGKETFRRIMNDQRLCDLPMILETPGGDYDKQINTLYGLVKIKG